MAMERRNLSDEFTAVVDHKINDWFREHPKVFDLLVKACRGVKQICKFFTRPEVIKIVAAAAAPFASIAVLGFGTLGPVAGTLAPAIQSTYYGGAVPAGSLFAIMQSLGMTGALTGTAAGASAVGGFVTWALTWPWKEEEHEHDE